MIREIPQVVGTGEVGVQFHCEYAWFALGNEVVPDEILDFGGTAFITEKCEDCGHF